MKLKVNPYLMIALTTIIWSTSGAFVKSLQLLPSSFAFIRMLTPMLIFYPFLRGKSKRVFGLDNRLMLVASGLNVFRLYFLFSAYTYAPIGVAAILLNTWPIFATLFSFLLLKEEIPKRNVFLLVMAFMGIILINSGKDFGSGEYYTWGLLAAMGSALVNALMVVIFKKQSLKYTWQESIFYQNFLGSLVLAPFFFVINPIPSGTQVGGAIFFGLLIGVLAYGLFFSALKKVKASTASLLAYIEVIGAVLIGIIFFDETFTWNLLLGGIFIVGSAALIRK